MEQTLIEEMESMMSSEDTFNQKINLTELFPKELTLVDLPSHTELNFSTIRSSYVGRKQYIARMGFPLISKEFALEIKEEFESRGIKSFVEIEAGNGALTILLNQMNLSGVGYTLDPDSGEHNWGMKKTEIFNWARSQSLLKFKDIRELQLPETPDMIMASWIPYEGGDEVIEFFDNNSTSEYFLVIGEGWGGCTANDNFHEWLDNNFVEIWQSREYKSFYAIYDSVILYKRKGYQC